MAAPIIPTLGLSTALILGAMVSTAYRLLQESSLPRQICQSYVQGTCLEMDGVFALLLLAEGTIFIYLLLV